MSVDRIVILPNSEIITENNIMSNVIFSNRRSAERHFPKKALSQMPLHRSLPTIYVILLMPDNYSYLL